MKITDRDLLAAIWKNQLRLLSKGVLIRYIGRKYGLVNDDEFWYFSASSEHIASRHRITGVIGRKQLRVRITDLIDKGEIHSVYGKRLLTFCINSEKARQAFNDAREFWISKGVPHCCANAAFIDNVDELTAECETMLQQRYI